MGGVEGSTNSMKSFVVFLNENNLMDMERRRTKFTWTNGCYGDYHIQERLDRVFISQDFITKFWQ